MKKIYISILCSCLSLLSLGQEFKMPCDNLRKNPMARRSMNSVVGSNDQVAVYEYNGGLRLAIALNGGTSGTPSMVFEDIPAWLDHYRTLAITCADLDGDKFEEVIIAYQDGSTNNVSIAAYHVTATGSSADVQLISALSSSYNCRFSVVADYALRAENGKIELHTVQLDPEKEQEQVVLSYLSESDNQVHHEVYAQTEFNPFLQVGNQTIDTPVSLGQPGTNFYNVEPWDVAFDDFNLDRKHELAYVQRNASNSIDSPRVQIYEMTYDADTSNTVSFTLRDAIVLNPSSYGNMVKPEIATGDLNGDQIPEIVVADLVGNNYSGFPFNSNTILNGTKAVQMLQVQVRREFLNGVWIEIPGLKLLALTSSPGFLVTGFSAALTDEATSSSANIEFNVMDYDHDHRDDIVFTGPSRTVIVKGRSAGLVPRCGDPLANNQYPIDVWNATLQTASSILTIQHTGVINNRKGFSCSSLTDISVDGNPEFFKLESKYAPEGTQRLFLTKYQYNSTTDFASTTSYELAQSAGTGGFNCALASGDLSGDGYELGTPFTRRFDDVSQPTVVLCAPPVHYDCFTDGCLSASLGGLEATASYTVSTVTQRSIESSSTSAWSMEASVGGGFSAGVASVSASFNTSYGESFETIGMEDISNTTVTEFTVSGDDQLLYTKTPYQVTEYPILKGGNVVSHTISLMALSGPTQASAGVNGPDCPLSYIPTHEWGNIFSYRNDANPDTLEDLLGPTPHLALGATNTLAPGYAWGSTVSISAANSNSTSSSYNGSIGASLSAEAFGSTLEISGSYDWGGMKTNTTTVTNTIDVSYAWGADDFNPLIPYRLRAFNTYGDNGILMLGWGTGMPNDISDWFQDNYVDKSDPAWNMPWRLNDYEGNVNLRYQTKSLWFTPYRENNPGQTVSGDIRNTYRIANPEPGDIVVVHARVFNMGLEETLPVPVSFYHGHPNLSLSGNGNAPLADYVSGFTEIEIPGIAPQMFVDVEFTVQLPNTDEPGFYERGARLYAVIDPSNFITDEIHEENNIAWKSLGSSLWGTVTDLTLDVNVCNDETACNYIPGANVSNTDACLYGGAACDDGNPASINDTISVDCACVGLIITGCMDVNACNYNASATQDDGSCGAALGSACDDNNTSTENDVIIANCICQGTLIGNGVNELSSGFTVFPNPSEGAYAITVNDGTSILELEVFDVSGKKIISTSPFSSQATVDLSNYAKGFYVLKIRTAHSSRTIRLERI